MNSLEPSYNFSDFPLSHPPAPHLSPVTPSAPPTGAPTSADQLLSTTEQDHFMSFLSDNFGSGSAFPGGENVAAQGVQYSMHSGEFGMHPYPSGWGAPPPDAPTGQGYTSGVTLPPLPPNAPAPALPPISSLTSLSSSTPQQPMHRPVLSNTQKRENHILSEQRRRNQIRQSYALLSLLLEGPEAGPGSNSTLRGASGMTRDMIFGGQVKGKKGRARGGGKKQGKAGTLFRAVEYVKWLKEGNEQLLKDVQEIRDRVQRWQYTEKPQYVY
ncbi:hypothetical protein DACRYDRAFT_117684 [Dacryopinax primogenitus]|uniref:BHLH domain-containing protein n=1 Tax=Dacryopinax primogenitus (strain DJM 731) TaxID=1858805 RepID=M5G8L7_DACPD|nr:uncharacterized protein DACRYDRAFT_117684 [Dacryopinax primogenitus]EJU00113.1 hypothetical protein DACRYDRAFT_117684 [Dacryopinax primogenitus]